MTWCERYINFIYISNIFHTYFICAVKWCERYMNFIYLSHVRDLITASDRILFFGFPPRVCFASPLTDRRNCSLSIQLQRNVLSDKPTW